MKNLKQLRLDGLTRGLLLGMLCLVLLSGCSGWRKSSSPPPSPLISPSEPPPSASGTPSSSSLIPLGGRTMFLDFPDVPIPQELSRSDGDSFVFQSGQLNVGLLTLRGLRVDVGSLISFYKAAMPRENWKSRGGFHAKRTVLIFEKPDKTCVINIYEQMFRTYVEIYVAPMTGAF